MQGAIKTLQKLTVPKYAKSKINSPEEISVFQSMYSHSPCLGKIFLIRKFIYLQSYLDKLHPILHYYERKWIHIYFLLTLLKSNFTHDNTTVLSLWMNKNGVTYLWIYTELWPTNESKNKLHLISSHTTILSLRKLHGSSFKGKTRFRQECHLTTKTWDGLELRYIFFENTNMNFLFLILVHYYYFYAIIALYRNQVQYQKVFPKNRF